MSEIYPWLPLWTDRWLLSRRVRMMTLEQRGLYVELLCHAWRDGSIPADPELCSRILGLEQDRFRRLFAGMMGLWMPGPQKGTLVNPRLEEIRQEQASKRETRLNRARNGAAKRWGKTDAAAEAPPPPGPGDFAEPIGGPSGSGPSGGGSDRDSGAGSGPETGPAWDAGPTAPAALPEQLPADGGENRSDPFGTAEDVMGRAHEALGWDAPTRNDVLRQTKPSTPLQQLVGLVGREEAVALFVQAAKTWRRSPTWTGVLSQRHALAADRRRAAQGTVEAVVARLTAELEADDARP